MYPVSSVPRIDAWLRGHISSRQEVELPAMANIAEKKSEDKMGRRHERDDAVLVDRHVNTVAAAEFLGLSPRTLEKWRVVGGGPRFRRLGRRLVRYAVRDLEQFAVEGTRTSTSDYGGCDVGN